jgi:hypothetical protein
MKPDRPKPYEWYRRGYRLKDDWMLWFVFAVLVWLFVFSGGCK